MIIDVYVCPVHVFVSDSPGVCCHYDSELSRAEGMRIFSNPGAHIPEAWCGRELIRGALSRQAGVLA